MSVNLTNLHNISKYEFNESILRSDNIIDSVFSASLSSLGDIYSYTIFFVLFLYFFYEFYRRDGIFLYDLSRSLALSSGFTLIFSILMLAIGYSGNFRVIIIFNFVFLSSVFAVYKQKSKY